MAHSIIRWLPAVVAPVLVAGAAVAVPMSAGASSGLPHRSAEQVLALIAKSDHVAGFSGTVQQTSNLGLPTLPTTGGAGGDSATSSAASTIDLLTGTHTAKVWISGTAERRVAVLDSMGERDVYQHGSSVWTWDSAGNSAVHTTLPTRTTARPETSTETPADAAKQLLAAVRPSTAIAVSGNETVAGQHAYVLTLTPKAGSSTTVGRVTIAVDGTTGLPLRTQVFAKGAQSPAVSVGFTDLTYGAPAASNFTFTPAKGVKVTQQAAPKRTQAGSGEHPSTAKKPTMIGTGWDSVLADSVGTLPKSVTGSSIFKQVTTTVSGGRAVQTDLVNVLLTDDGHVYAGAVPLSRLEAVAAQR